MRKKEGSNRKKRRKSPVDMFAHQYFDSALPVWMRGEQAQIYLSQILPPGEFEGTALSAPRRKTPAPEAEEESDSDLEDERYVPSALEGERGVGSPSGAREDVKPRTDKRPARRKGDKSFAEWLARKEKEDAVRMAREKQERKQRKQAEEDKRKAQAMRAELEDKSYEQWLAEREAASKKAAHSRQGRHAAATGGRSTAEVMRSVMERRGGSGGGGIPSDLHVRDPSKYQEIQYRGLMLLHNYVQSEAKMGKT